MDRSGVGRASQRSFASSMGRRGADSLQPLARGRAAEEQDAWEGAQLAAMLEVAQQKYDEGLVLDAKKLCEAIYQVDATWTDNLILLSAIHFALREHSESMFYCQQAIRVDPGAAEAYSNLGNALKEVGDVDAAIQAYLKAIQLKPRFADVYTNLAAAYAQQGDPDQAMTTLEMSLALDPMQAEAQNNMGCFLKARGDLERAKQCFAKAVQAKPAFAPGWSNLGGVHKLLGEYDDALACYQRAVEHAPTFADAFNNLGSLYFEMNKLEKAAESYERAVKLRPDFAIALSNLGNCYAKQGALSRALRMYQHAVQLEPGFPDCLVNMGNVLQRLHRVDEAIECYRVAIQRKPDHPHAYVNLGNALREKGLVREAVHCYVTACKLNPGFAVAWNNLAALLHEQGKPVHAVQYFEEALRIAPAFAEVHSNLGSVLRDIGDTESAIEAFTRAIQAAPALAPPFVNLGRCFRDAGRLRDALLCFDKALQLSSGENEEAFVGLHVTRASACVWDQREAAAQSIAEAVARHLARQEVRIGPLQPLHALHLAMPAHAARDAATTYARALTQSTVLLSMPKFRFRAKKPHERLRIGYVGACFGDHPIGNAIWRALEHHDRSFFDVYCYALNPADGSPCRDAIAESVEHFKDASALALADTARLIHADNIHILVNLTAFLRGDRSQLLALRPAPIQAHYLGFPGSLGAGLADYVIADAVALPGSLDPQFAELPVRLPSSMHLADFSTSLSDATDAALCPTREELGLPEHAFVLACFAPPHTLCPRTWELFCSVLGAAPRAILWLVHWSEESTQSLTDEAATRGIPSNRLVFSPLLPRDRHVRRLHAADVALDPLHLSATSTALECLWAGVPVLTVAGDRLARRLAASMNHAIGMAAFVKATEQEYRDMCVTLAGNPDMLARYRSTLQRNRTSHPLFDVKRTVASLESAYKAMWKVHEDGTSVRAIDVSDPAMARRGSTRA